MPARKQPPAKTVERDEQRQLQGVGQKINYLEAGLVKPKRPCGDDATDADTPEDGHDSQRHAQGNGQRQFFRGKIAAEK